VEPEQLSQWVPIFADFATYAVAVFVAVFGVTTIADPTLLGVSLGFAATLFGAPAARRWDTSRRKNGNGKNGTHD
jgi:uncharacterized membrane protein SpoIIM required for sporulation